MGHRRYSTEEIARRGREIYESRIRPQIDEGANRGKMLSIDIETGEYEMGDDSLAATHRALARHPGAALYGKRIGYRSVARVGGEVLVGMELLEEQLLVIQVRDGCSVELSALQQGC